MIPFDNTYRRLPETFYAPTAPTPVGAPALIAVNDALADRLGIDPAWLRSDDGLAVLSGNRVARGSEPLAMAYAGHQFGGFSPQLGDGRAVLLGEVVARDGVRYDVQLKGAGRTPFSRGGDGRSALGPVLREYVVSEAMAALGVPTTRALAAVTSGEQVYRETPVAGGVFTRVARSHIRVGTFQWFAARRDIDNLRVLADYVIERHDPDAREAEHPYRALLAGTIERQASLVAHWMQIGFVHGVMNTDNSSVTGDTIDFGPCAFLDEYHSAKTFSSIDHHGRYAFGNQGSIAFWNLARFAETLLPLLDDDEERAIAIARECLEPFPALFQTELDARMTAKIGLGADDARDRERVLALLSAMEGAAADFTLVFRSLTRMLAGAGDEAVKALFTETEPISGWLADWRARVAEVGIDAALEKMRRSNPVLIPRNHRVEAVIRAGYEGDFAPFHRLNDALAQPYEERDEFAEFETPPAPDEVVTQTFCGT